jgi:Spirocyclase AveC-like
MTVLSETRDAGAKQVRAPVPAEQKKTLPVNIWAVVGILIIAFEVWVLLRWVTGPYFVRVPTGPSDPPALMKVCLVGWQVVSLPAALGLLYWFVIRPWRRDRRVGVDGILVIAFLTMWWQDPISSYGGHWFTYNTWMINRGSWVNSIPGWSSFGKPGAMLSEPVLFTPGAYSYIFVIVMFFGCRIMRRTQTRFPRISNLGLIAVCFVAMYVFDVILEGLLWLPMGVFAYQGGHWGIFANTYHKFPLHEGLTIGSVFTAVACIRYFTNDRGQTVVEHGINEVRGGAARKFATRAFAMIAAVQLAMFVGYNVPNFWVGTHSTAWPADIQKRSYFTSGICGEGTDRACPGPGVPLVRNNNGDPAKTSAYVAPNGTLVIPPGTRIPPVVPFDTKN